MTSMFHGVHTTVEKLCRQITYRHTFRFDQSKLLEKRREEAEKLLIRFSDRVPIIVEKNTRSQLDDIDKHKFLVPCDITIGDFLQVIRKRLKIKDDTSIFIFVHKNSESGQPLTISRHVKDVYDQYKSEDLFLKLTFCEESTFGSE